jgi:hypothetical protein
MNKKMFCSIFLLVILFSYCYGMERKFWDKVKQLEDATGINLVNRDKEAHELMRAISEGDLAKVKKSILTYGVSINYHLHRDLKWRVVD